jgi:hypothetical protein
MSSATRVLAFVSAAVIAVAAGVSGSAQGGNGVVARQATSDKCVSFHSPEKLAAGTPFRAALFRGLEFRLSAEWDIRVGPIDEPQMDYLWLVSPPIQTAPHRQIGPGYGLTARQSASIGRPLRFVVTRADYTAARAAIDLKDAGETLKRMAELGKGRLTLNITDYRIRDVKLADGQPGDAFDWIAFKGEACAPRD